MKPTPTFKAADSQFGSFTPNPQDEAYLRSFYQYTGKLSSRALAEKARLGEAVGCAPTGYISVRTEEGVKVETDRKVGPLVREAFDMAAKAKTSLRSILAELTPKGLVSCNGRPFGPPALLNILTNPFYTGYIRYKGQFYLGNHPALVKPSLFESVQRRLMRRRRNSRTPM